MEQLKNTEHLIKKVAKYPDFVRVLLRRGFIIRDVVPKFNYKNESVFLFYLTEEEAKIYDALYAEHRLYVERTTRENKNNK